MTKEDFEKLWTSNYPETVPISHLFKHTCSDRWFRIHSLPESKRYPDKEDEWNILLTRQNEIITDLFGINTPIFIMTGEYNWSDERKSHIAEGNEVFKPFVFTPLDHIQLHKVDSEQYDESDTYRPAFTTTVWKPHSCDNILRKIATDKVRAFFVSFDKNVIIAPYDGGVDFVLKDGFTKDNYRNKYRQWLSKGEDEL